MEVATIDELQEKAGLFETNKTGIIYRAVAQSDIEELLKDYIETSDNHMYYKYGDRILLRKYEHAYIMDNLNFIESAIYYALKAEEYRLKTLINSTNLEYNPINNYDITETIVTTATISANAVKGTQTNKKDVSQIKTTDEGGNSMKYGTSTVTGSDTTTYGEQSLTGQDTTEYGNKTTSNNNTNTVSPYNIDNYKPNEHNEGSETVQQHTDTFNTSRTDAEHKDVVSTSKTTQEHTDTGTTNNTRTQSPHTETDTLGERTDTNNRNDDINKERHASGMYGYTTAQTLIEAERGIADLSIVEEIIKIVLKTICNSLAYMI